MSTAIGSTTADLPPKRGYHAHRGEAVDDALLEAHSTADLVHAFNCPDDDGKTPCDQPAAQVKRGFPNEITCLICHGFVDHTFKMARLHAYRTIGKLMVG